MSDIWTFNLRSTKTNQDSDSDSNSDNDDAPTNSETEETRLLKDLDLSSREETVVYKPNPFSIAKINAASRSNRPAIPIIDPRPAKPAPKKPQGRIVDSFNLKKKDKKVSHPSTAHPKGAKVTSANANATHIATLRPPTNPGIVSPKSGTPSRADISPVPPRISAERILTPPVLDVGAGNVLLTIPAHTSTVFPALPSQKVILKKKFRPPAPISFSSPFKAPSREIPRTTNHYSGNRISLSSPPRLTQSSLLSAMSSTNTSRVQSRYPARNLIGTSQMQEPFYQPHRTISRDPQLTPESLPLAWEPPHMPTPSSFARPHSMPAAKSPVVFAHQPLPGSTFCPETEHAEVSSYHWDDPSIGAPSADPHSQLRDVCLQCDLNLPPQLPPSSPILSPTATPSPPPRRKRKPARKPVSPHKSARILKRDAYEYLRSDPDDDWSTLPARKKSKALEQVKPRIKGVRTTAAFRLPGTSIKAKVTGISATSERRVVTFLPPPLKARNVEVLVEDVQPSSAESPPLDVDGPRALKHARTSSESSPSNATPKRRRISENPYPTPTNSRLTPGDGTIVVVDPPSATSPKSPSTPAVRPSTHRIPSPPTSDPLPEYDPDVHTVAVTVGHVSQRYPRTKGLMRQ